MWMLPDPDALPEIASGKASPVLTSYIEIERDIENGIGYGHENASSGNESFGAAGPVEDTETGTMQPTRLKPTTLNIAVYLETVIDLMQHGCDWEVYSYILVHLASQLTNQAFSETQYRRSKN
jgi:hypothetical protein